MASFRWGKTLRSQVWSCPSFGCNGVLCTEPIPEGKVAISRVFCSISMSCQAVPLTKLRAECSGPSRSVESVFHAGVPRALMIASEVPLSDPSGLGKFAASDPLLRGMPSVVLALRLLQEEPEVSAFAPYLQMLPRSFPSLPLYQLDALLALKRSPPTLRTAVRRSSMSLRISHLQYDRAHRQLWQTWSRGLCLCGLQPGRSPLP